MQVILQGTSICLLTYYLLIPDFDTDTIELFDPISMRNIPFIHIFLSSLKQEEKNEQVSLRQIDPMSHIFRVYV